MTQRTRPRKRTPLALLVLACVALAAALALLVHETSRPPEVAVDQEAQAHGAAAETLAADARTAPPDAAPLAPSEARSEIAAGAVLRGSFVAPAGPWPGGGRVELYPAVEIPPGGFMRMMGDTMAEARRDDRDDESHEKRTTGLAQLFTRGEPIVQRALDASGAFAIPDPPAGHFELRLAHAHLQTQPLDLVLTGESRDVGALPARLAGALLVLVSDPDGAPVAQAKVRLAREFDITQFSDPSKLGDLTTMMRQFRPLEGTTDARGACSFEGLEHESWTLATEASGWVDDERPVHAVAGEDNVVRVEMARGGALRVRARSVAGSAASGIQVQVRFPHAPEAKPNFAVTVRTTRDQGTSLVTGADGSAEAQGLPPGPATVRLDTPGFLPEQRSVTLVSGQTTDVELTLESGAAVSGRVLDEDGAPIPAARVMRQEFDQKIMGMDAASFVGLDVLSLAAGARGVPCDAEGRFTLGGFVKGDTVELIAAARGFDPVQQSATVGSSDVEFRLLRCTTVSGTVVADGSRDPITDFEVRLEKRAWLVFDRPVVVERFAHRADGKFAIDNVPRDRFRAVITSPGRADWSESVDFEKGSVDLGVVELGLPSAIEGTVVDPDGAPVEGASVRVAKGGTLDAVGIAKFMGAKIEATDAQGRFELTGLAERRLRLLVDKDGYAPLQSETIEVERGSTTSNVLLRLGRGGRLRGRVVDEHGTGLTGWTIQVTPANGRSFHSTTTDGDGNFFLAGLGEGTHNVQAHGSDLLRNLQGEANLDGGSEGFDFSKVMDAALKWTVRDKVVIRDGEEAELELVFEHAANDDEALTRVRGRVRVGGRPLDHGMVTLLRSGAQMPAHIESIHGGTFEIEHVQPGAYVARVQTGMLSAALGAAQEVHVPETESCDVDLDLPGGSIAGRVTRADGMGPMAGVVLTLIGADRDATAADRADLGEGTALADQGGAFRFDGLAPGTYDVFAKELLMGESGQHSGRLSDVRIGDGEQRTGLVLRLQGGGGLRVAVRDASGPRSNALVTLLRPDGTPIDLFHRALTDTAGVAAFTDVPEGRYRAAVDAPRAAPIVTPDVDVHAGATREIEVALRGGCEVSVRLDGEIPARATALLVSYAVWQPDGALLRSDRIVVPPGVTSGAELRLGVFAPGRYRIRLSSTAGRVERDEEVPDQPAKTITLRAADLLR